MERLLSGEIQIEFEHAGTLIVGRGTADWTVTQVWSLCISRALALAAVVLASRSVNAAPAPRLGVYSRHPTGSAWCRGEHAFSARITLGVR